VFLVLLCACASAAPPKPTEPDPKQDAHLFYPLAPGNSWTYAESSTGKRETIKIIGQDGPWFLDDHGGRLRYEPDGVRDADRYLLRTPIATGAKWSAVENLIVQRFEVTTVGTSVGRFNGCAVVRNEQPIPKGGKFVTEWTYAPKVGLVQIKTFTVAGSGKEVPQTQLDLVDYRVQ
jgi:hypothetical protein